MIYSWVLFSLWKKVAEGHTRTNPNLHKEFPSVVQQPPFQKPDLEVDVAAAWYHQDMWFWHIMSPSVTHPWFHSIRKLGETV